MYEVVLQMLFITLTIINYIMLINTNMKNAYLYIL